MMLIPVSRFTEVQNLGLSLENHTNHVTLMYTFVEGSPSKFCGSLCDVRYSISLSGLSEPDLRTRRDFGQASGSKNWWYCLG